MLTLGVSIRVLLICDNYGFARETGVTGLNAGYSSGLWSTRVRYSSRVGPNPARVFRLGPLGMG